ncbi:hypothetical protein ILUMI_13667 [Ignelater luminosus]|uniref:C2H2-type domain-containing protein n=1 Tax=Ignelater luminosus TaxID=2038154 RepID=A0A8K0CXD2_IGNLU|nr:hypothetical protein ILUMI_13667 [Ignelater luminosus]
MFLGILSGALNKNNTCHKCGRSFTRLDNLQRHVKYICGVAPQFQCSVCLYSTKHKYVLMQHLKKKHNYVVVSCPGPAALLMDTSYRAYLCTFQMPTLDNLVFGSGQNLFYCSSCYVGYKYKHNLNRHRKYECGKTGQFQCTICKKKYKQQYYLKIHMRTHSQCLKHNAYVLDENGRHVCLKCGLSYKNKGHLTRHLKYECGVEPKFHCTQCFRRYKHKSDLRKHFRNAHVEISK